MKRIARAILRAIINDLPIQQREYGQAMLAELEETNRWQALVWASGGIQLWVQTRGGEIMKNAAFWFGLVAIGILAGGLYVTKGLYWAVPVAVIGVIAFAALRPRDSLPVALLLGLSLPIADLLKFWIAVRDLVSKIDPQGITTITVRLSDIDAKMIMPSLTDFANVFTNQLPQLTAVVLLGAIVIAGIAAFVRSRVTAQAHT
jgi:hypothetical protein